MEEFFNTYRPEGFTNVNSYLFVENPEELKAFLVKVFSAREVHLSLKPGGEIGNLILKVGDTNIMISQAEGQFLNMRTALYLYVNDVDKVHEKAIENGAKLVFPPDDMAYGDRQSGIIDPAGNYWWISKRLINKKY